MKRRGFLGLLTGLAALPAALKSTTAQQNAAPDGTSHVVESVYGSFSVHSPSFQICQSADGTYDSRYPGGKQ